MDEPTTGSSFDAKSIERLKLVYPHIRIRAAHLRSDILKETGLALRITTGLRSMGEQAALYARGRSIPGPGASGARPLGSTVTNARPGASIHHYGLAFDVAFAGVDPFLDNLAKTDSRRALELWLKVGQAGMALGLVWGFDWNGNGIVDKNDFDKPHFQDTYGLGLPRIRELYSAGGLASVWDAVDTARGAARDWQPHLLPEKEQLAV